MLTSHDRVGSRASARGFGDSTLVVGAGAPCPSPFRTSLGVWLSRWVAVVLSYAALVVVFTWPLAIHTTDLVVSGRFDAWGSLWGGMWFSGIQAREGPLLHTYMLGWPFGISLTYFDSWIWAIWSALTGRCLGQVLSLNVYTLLWLMGTCLLQYRFSRRLGLSVLGSFVSGVVLGLSSASANILLEGAGYHLALGCLPLFFHALLDLVERGGVWRAGLAGAALAFAAYNTGYFGLLAVVGAPFVLVFGLRARPRPWLRSTRDLAVAISVALALLGPLLAGHYTNRYAYGPTEIQEGQLIPEPPLGQQPEDAVALENLLRPRQPKSGFMVVSLFPGTALVTLVLFAIVVFRRRKGVIPMVGMVVICFGLGLGTDLKVGGRSVLTGHIGRKLAAVHPVRLVNRLPVISRNRFPARYGWLALLALGVLAGAGLDHLRRGRGRGLIRLAAAVVVVAECLLVAGRPIPRPMMQVALPRALEALVRDRAPGAVLHVAPGEAPIAERTLMWQLRHGRPLGYEGHFRHLLPVLLLLNRLVWHRVLHLSSRGLAGVSRDELLLVLRSLGFRYVVVHESWLRSRLDPSFSDRNYSMAVGLEGGLWSPAHPIHALKRVLARDLVKVEDTGVLALSRVSGRVTRPSPRTRVRLSPKQVRRMYSGESIAVLLELARAAAAQGRGGSTGPRRAGR